MAYNVPGRQGCTQRQIAAMFLQVKNTGNPLLGMETYVGGIHETWSWDKKRSVKRVQLWNGNGEVISDKEFSV